MRKDDTGRTADSYLNRCCGDCGAKEGELHLVGCDMEECLVCGDQAISCEEHCFYPGDSDFTQGNPRPSFITGNRIPYVIVPVACARCLKPFPGFFRVPEFEWQVVVPPSLHKKVLCRDCYDRILEWQIACGNVTREEIKLWRENDPIANFFRTAPSRLA